MMNLQAEMRKRCKPGFWDRCMFGALLLTGVISCLAMVSCTARGQKLASGAQAPGVYRPPTMAIGHTPVLTERPTATILVPTSISVTRSTPTNPPCTNQLKYIKDVTIPDGAMVNPGETLDKQWLVENTGSCNWNDRYRLKLIAGQDLGFPSESALFPARNGSQATIRLVFDSPKATGAYRSAWQAYDPAGKPFGDPIYIEFVVNMPTPQP